MAVADFLFGHEGESAAGLIATWPKLGSGGGILRRGLGHLPVCE